MGKPDRVEYFAAKHENGIDIHGTVMLQYGDVVCQCIGAKDTMCDNSFLLLGDSQLAAEPVDREQLLAKTAFVRRKDRICRPGGLCWWFFACPWRLCAPLRPLIGKALALLRRK